MFQLQPFSGNPRLDVRGLGVCLNGKRVLEDISFTLGSGSLCAVVGPNGAGKSTLLRALLGRVDAESGQAVVSGIQEKTQRFSYVPQRNDVDWQFPLNVLEVVLMGSWTRHSWWRKPNAEEKEQAVSCLQVLGLESLAEQPIGALSGGQQQRVFIARALMQDAAICLLDEPMNSVDAPSEKHISALMESLAAQGRIVLCVHHNLSDVKRLFPQTLLLNRRCLGFGASQDVLTPENTLRAYGALPDEF